MFKASRIKWLFLILLLIPSFLHAKERFNIYNTKEIIIPDYKKEDLSYLLCLDFLLL